MKKCTQCGNNAMYENNGHLLCLNCFYKFKSIEQQEMVNLLHYKNFLMESMERSVGMPGILPKHKVPQPPPIFQHNVSINNSTVGVVNTGYIESLNVNLSDIATGNKELANKMIEFTEKLIEERFSPDTKNEILEQIEYISRQLAGKEQPKKSIIKSILASIPTLISSSESLLNIWATISKMISDNL